MRRVLAAALAAIVLAVLPALPAHAASLVGRVTTPVGELQVWWDGSQNTARMVHTGPSYGRKAMTVVQICRFQGYGCTGPLAQDSGYYAYYAGPVGSGPSRGSCVYAHGEITWQGFTYVANFAGACT